MTQEKKYPSIYERDSQRSLEKLKLKDVLLFFLGLLTDDETLRIFKAFFRDGDKPITELAETVASSFKSA